MKTLSQIIDEVQDGQKPDYEDLRYAVVAILALRHFDSNALMKLYKREKEGKYRKEFFGLDYEVKESFRRYKTALEMPPKQYVGPSHDPDTEECQRWRKMAHNVLNHVMKKNQPPT